MGPKHPHDDPDGHVHQIAVSYQSALSRWSNLHDPEGLLKIKWISNAKCKMYNYNNVLKTLLVMKFFFFLPFLLSSTVSVNDNVNVFSACNWDFPCE